MILTQEMAKGQLMGRAGTYHSGEDSIDCGEQTPGTVAELQDERTSCQTSSHCGRD